MRNLQMVTRMLSTSARLRSGQVSMKEPMTAERVFAWEGEEAWRVFKARQAVLCKNDGKLVWQKDGAKDEVQYKIMMVLSTAAAILPPLAVLELAIPGFNVFSGWF